MKLTAIKQEEFIGGQRLILGDCMEVMLELGRFDACVCDPPYGIDYGKAGGFSESSGWKNWRGKAEWDKSPPEGLVFNVIREVSKDQIIWGGNYFTDMLPPTMRWLIWDKGQRGFTLADCEMAWTNQNKAIRVFDYARGKANNEEKFHPTQKPIALMEWCLGFLPNSQTVLDPFMGSGTTLVACQRMGRMGTGIELDPEYFSIACKRVDEATRQPDMFVSTPVQAAKQGDLF